MTTTYPSPAEVLQSDRLFSRHFLKVQNKSEKKELVPFRWNRAQIHFEQNRTGRDLVLKARQLGFSTLIQAIIFKSLVTQTTTSITLAHDDDTTQIMRRMADRFWKNIDPPPPRKYANARLTTYPDFDSASIIATAGNKQAGRGEAPSHLHGSEVAFWPDAEKLITGAMQGGVPRWVVLESTPNGAGGYFYDLCMEALSDPDPLWKIHFYPWWWEKKYREELKPGEELTYTDDELKAIDKAAAGGFDLQPEQIKWRRLKKKELKRFYGQEYPEDVIECFLTSGSGYFSDIDIDYTAPEGVEYNPNHTYVAGLDFGQTVDYTVLVIIDETTREEVEIFRLKGMPWREILRRVKARHDHWHVEKLIAEGNSIGQPNIEYLEELGVDAEVFTTDNKSKGDGMALLHTELEEGLKLLPDPVGRHEMSVFISTRLDSGRWKLAAEKPHHDDIVIGRMLAVKAYAGQAWLLA